jgi:hypothetical protein
VNILPFHHDPGLDLVAIFLGITAASLAIGLLLRRVVDRFFAADDPRRQLVAQALLYGGTFVAVVVTVWLGHRGGAQAAP